MTIEKDIEAIRAYLHESKLWDKPFEELKRVEEAAARRPEPRGGRYISSTEQSQIEALWIRGIRPAETQVRNMVEELQSRVTAKESSVDDKLIAARARAYVTAERAYSTSSYKWANEVALDTAWDALVDAVDGRPQPKGADTCGFCDGTRKVDSGGQDGAGNWIERDCPYCTEEAEGGDHANH
jgi:hypothetical protein